MPTLKAKATRVYQRAFDGQPFEVLLAIMCLLSGIPLVLQGAAPESLEAALPEALVRLWGIELALGAIATLAGLTSGIAAIERFGLLTLSAAALVYGLVLLWVAWPASIIAGPLTIGFGLACLARRSSMTRTVTLREVHVA